MPEHDPFTASEPEYLDGSPHPRAARRRTPLVALAAAGVLGAVAVAGFAAFSLMSTGEQAASVVPADAVAYVSLDLDPSAAQKLEAIRIVEKFPALDEELGLDAQDDLRRWAFEELASDACALDYDDDVAPWIGERVAVAVLPARESGSEPVPMVALQVTDQEAASSTLADVAACVEATEVAGGEPAADPGYAFSGDYVVIAETLGTAEEIVVAAASAALADDEDFLRWTGEVGDPGFVTGYVAPTVVDVLSDLPDGLVGQLEDDPGMPGLTGRGPGLLPGPGGGPGFGQGDSAWLREVAADFRGMASVLRFRDGAVEVEVAGGLPDSARMAAGASTGVADLPATTGAAFGIALPEGWAAEAAPAMDEMSGGMLDTVETETGLELPEDLERLLGRSVTVAVDSSIEPGDVAGPDAASLPVGVRVEGDVDEIMDVVDKVRAAWAPVSQMLVVEAGDGAVAFGLDPAYVATLAGAGGLGETANFRAVVPEADRAGGVVYVDFAAGDAWVERLATELDPRVPDGTAEEVHRNMEALDALGFSGWDEGEVSRGLFRLTTD